MSFSTSTTAVYTGLLVKYINLRLKTDDLVYYSLCAFRKLINGLKNQTGCMPVDGVFVMI
jgi:hypothetical protein